MSRVKLTLEFNVLNFYNIFYGIFNGKINWWLGRYWNHWSTISKTDELIPETRTYLFYGFIRKKHFRHSCVWNIRFIFQGKCNRIVALTNNILFAFGNGFWSSLLDGFFLGHWSFRIGLIYPISQLCFFCLLLDKYSFYHWDFWRWLLCAFLIVFNGSSKFLMELSIPAMISVF